MAFLKQAISQNTTLSVGEPPWSSSKVDWLLPSELPSELPSSTSDKDSTGKREQVNQKANSSPGESLSASPLTPNGELGLIAASISELPKEPPTTLPESDDNLFFPRESETTSSLGELLSESRATLSEGESISETLEMKNAPHVGELLSDSPTSPADAVETADVPAEETGDTQVPMELPPRIPDHLTGAALARRLGVSPGSISRNKTKDNFGQWTSQHDPNGINWHFDGQTFRRVGSSLPP